MFTTIMYGFINEVTRQQGTAELPLKRIPRSQAVKSVARPARAPGSATGSSGRRAPLPSQYRVLADSFRRAAGFL